MNKSTLLLVCLAVTCIFSSCQKEIIVDASQKPGSSNGRLKGYTEEITISGKFESSTFKLNYDGDGRLAGWVAADKGEKFMYNYQNASYTSGFYRFEKLVMQQTSFLNSSMLIDSTVQPYDEHGDHTEKYFYNQAGQLIRVNKYYHKRSGGTSLLNSQNYSYDKAGNLTSESDNISVTNYEYYPEITSNIFISAPYVQKPKSLVKTTSYSSGDVTEIFGHTYTFDNNKRLVAEKIVKSESRDVIVRKFIY